jgi:hypothetical protein
MITPDGRVFTENNYEGYGEFGGKDFYELLAELNGLESNRELAIDLVFKNNPNGDNTEGVIYPKFVEELEDDIKAQYEKLPNPQSCGMQGFFYGGDDEEDEEEEWYTLNNLKLRAESKGSAFFCFRNFYLLFS